MNTNDIKYDETTGLPELPEGYVWFVARPTDVHYDAPCGPITRDSAYTRLTLIVVIGQVKAEWVNERVVTHGSADVLAVNYEAVRDSYYYGTQYYANVVKPVHWESVFKAEDTPKVFTPEYVRELATKAYESWISEQERRRKEKERNAANSKFVGVYPPNSVLH